MISARNDRLFHILDLGRIRQIRRIRQVDHFTVCLMHLIDNARCRRHEIQVEILSPDAPE